MPITARTSKSLSFKPFAICTSLGGGTGSMAIKVTISFNGGSTSQYFSQESRKSEVSGEITLHSISMSQRLSWFLLMYAAFSFCKNSVGYLSGQTECPASSKQLNLSTCHEGSREQTEIRSSLLRTVWLRTTFAPGFSAGETS